MFYEIRADFIDITKAATAADKKRKTSRRRKEDKAEIKGETNVRRSRIKSCKTRKMILNVESLACRKYPQQSLQCLSEVPTPRYVRIKAIDKMAG